MTQNPTVTSEAARASLYRKIATVTAAVSRIPKNGKNTFHNYRYATESDITDGLRDLLQEHGLAFLPPSVLAWERDETADNPKTGPRTRVQMQFELACCDTGEVYTSVIWGEGQDSGDKAFYKAYTGAVKYFLMKTFLIATGDDPEQDDHRRDDTQRQPRQQAPAQNGSAAKPQAKLPLAEQAPKTERPLVRRLRELVTEARTDGLPVPSLPVPSKMTDDELYAAVRQMEALINPGMTEESLPDTLPDVRSKAAA